MPVHPAAARSRDESFRVAGQSRLTFAVKRHVIQGRGGWRGGGLSTDPLARVKRGEWPRLATTVLQRSCAMHSSGIFRKREVPQNLCFSFTDYHRLLFRNCFERRKLIKRLRVSFSISFFPPIFSPNIASLIIIFRKKDFSNEYRKQLTRGNRLRNFLNFEFNNSNTGARLFW